MTKIKTPTHLKATPKENNSLLKSGQINADLLDELPLFNNLPPSNQHTLLLAIESVVLSTKNQAPSNQAPSNQAPSNQAPSTKKSINFHPSVFFPPKQDTQTPNKPITLHLHVALHYVNHTQSSLLEYLEAKREAQLANNPDPLPKSVGRTPHRIDYDV